jgi:hypothetical protein
VHTVCRGECSEARDQVEQLSIIISVLLCCVLSSVVVAISLVAIDIICLHDVFLMLVRVEGAHGGEGRAPG